MTNDDLKTKYFSKNNYFPFWNLRIKLHRKDIIKLKLTASTKQERPETQFKLFIRKFKFA